MSLPPVISALEEMGLACAEDTLAVLEKLTIQQVRKQSERFYSAICETQSLQSQLAASTSLSFTFLASSSVRGDSGCRDHSWQKLHSLGRYAALYSDCLLLPVPLHVRCPVNNQEHIRHTLAVQIDRLLLLRPLLDSGLLKVIPDHNCIEHGAAPQTKLAEEKVRQVIADKSQSFKLFIHPKRDSGRIHLELRGPQEFIEHGTIHYFKTTAPEWLKEVEPCASAELSHQTLLNSGILERMFWGMVNDVLTHRNHGAEYNASYLTDLKGEAELFGRECPIGAETRSKAIQSLCHVVPLFSELPIATLVRVRKEEPDAFIRYRHALNKIIRQRASKHDELEPAAAKEIFMDELQPRLDELQQAAKTKAKSARKSAAQNAVVSASIGIGLTHFGASPVQSAMAAMAYAATAASQIRDSLTTSDEIKNNDLYYLLRLQRERM